MSILAASPPLGRRLIRNFAWVGSSQAVIAGLGIVSLALTARALGPAGLGILAVIESYTRSVARILHPEPWQALIKHGAEALERGDRQALGQLAWLSLMTDIALGGLTALVGVAIALWLGTWMQAVQGHAALLALAAASGLIGPRPTAMGLLRLYDRFDLLARIDMGTALIRLALIAAAWWAGAGLWAFVALFVVWTVADSAIPMVFALREMRRHGDRLLPAPPARILRDHPGLLRLFVNSNLSVTLRQLRQRFDVVLLAVVMPAPLLGLYQIARRMSEAALRIGRPVSQIVFPEFARLAARGDFGRFRRLLLIATLGLTGLMLVLLLPVALNMQALVTLAFGPEFAPAATSVTIMAAAVALYIAGMTAGPALMSLSRDSALTLVTLASTVVFFAGLGPAARIWGVEGAAAMHLVANAVWLALIMGVALTALRRGGRT